MQALVTGGAGFVGHHLVEFLLRHTDWHLHLPVTFRHRGRSARLQHVLDSTPDAWDRVHILHHDLRARFSPDQLRELRECEVIFNVAAESHVDRSISDPAHFIESNTAMAVTVLELARIIQPRLFLQVSTDEVYGAAALGHAHAEWESILPSNPYSASKACQEAVAISYWRTYGVPLVLTNTMNIFGERQDREKFIPGAIRRVLAREPVIVHGQPGSVGSRFYLHAREQAAALYYLANLRLKKGASALGDQLIYRDDPSGGRVSKPPRFNVVGEREVANDEMARMIGAALGIEPVIHFEDFHATRPGHDRRYALNGSKLASFGWTPSTTLEQNIHTTARWYAEHQEWLI
jgi:dTDP-glucose 4,6-dehydratase